MLKRIFVLIAVLLMSTSGAMAASTSFSLQDTLDDFREGFEDQSREVEGGDGFELAVFQDTGEEGAVGVVNTIQRFLDLFKLVVTPIALLFMAIMGMRMVSAGRESEEVATKAKQYIQFTLEGLIVIFLADQVVDVVFGPSGEAFRGGEAGARATGRSVSDLIQGLYGLIQVLIGSIAVFMLVTAGMRYIAGSATEDQIEKAKKQITWALVGLFVVGVAEFVVKGILFENQGRSINVSNAELLFAQVTNFVAGTIGTFSFVAFLYAGYLYVTAAGEEDQVSKAKKIILMAVLGILLALSAFALTTTLVELDASR